MSTLDAKCVRVCVFVYVLLQLLLLTDYTHTQMCFLIVSSPFCILLLCLLLSTSYSYSCYSCFVSILNDAWNGMHGMKLLRVNFKILSYGHN